MSCCCLVLLTHAKAFCRTVVYQRDHIRCCTVVLFVSGETLRLLLVCYCRNCSILFP